VLLGFFQHLHRQIGSHYLANHGGKIERGMAAAAGNIKHIVIVAGL